MQISHIKEEINIEDIHQRIDGLEDPSLPFDTLKSFADELIKTDIGSFLLQNKGLNGYWTAYAILYGLEKDNLIPIEDWLLNKSPVVLATRERFYIFQQELKKVINNNMTIASLPCGLMDDLLTLDLSSYNNVNLFGIDIDTESLKLAQENAKKNNKPHAEFIEKDAWNLRMSNQFDIMLSNGLNIYEKNHDKLIHMYKEFHKSLKDNGILITSFLTPPPTLNPKSPWQNYDVMDILKQKAIFSDIIGTAWQNFMMEDDFILLLNKSGFWVEEVIYDKQQMFPTVIARKS